VVPTHSSPSMKRWIRAKDQARQVISAWVEEFYNPRRRHGSAGMKSPIEFE